jgi:uncharacterized membrane protein
MDSRAKLFGHPIHTMLVAFPLGLLVTAVVFDVVWLVTHAALWHQASYVMIGAGIIGGLLAAPFGAVDWIAIPWGTRAKRIGAMHGIGNLALVALFAASWLLRGDPAIEPPAIALALSFAAAPLGAVTAWLGGELVDRLGVGVDDGANLNAPNSLSGHDAAAVQAIEATGD